MNDLIAQGIGFVGLVLIIVSFQTNRRNLILTTMASSIVCWAIHFLLLEAWTAAAINVVAAIRTFVFTRDDVVEKKRNLFLFYGAFIIAGVVTWSGILSALVVVAQLLETTSLFNKNTTYIRLLMLSCQPLWFIHNYLVSSYVGVLTAVLFFISILVSIVRFDILKKDENDSTALRKD